MELKLIRKVLGPIIKKTDNLIKWKRRIKMILALITDSLLVIKVNTPKLKLMVGGKYKQQARKPKIIIIMNTLQVRCPVCFQSTLSTTNKSESTSKTPNKNPTSEIFKKRPYVVWAP